MEIKIGNLYGNLLNLYGDVGNVAVLKKRLEWRGIDVEVVDFTLEDDVDFTGLDIVFIGGGGYYEQSLVCARLREMKAGITEYIENDGVLLAIDSGFQILGRYYKTETEEIEGLSVIDMHTDYNKKRIIGKTVLKSELCEGTVIGFVNRAGRTAVNGRPLGIVKQGSGKNEGVIYKNVIGTYLHGPLLPLNPELADYILKTALIKKYGDNITLPPLDDSFEELARKAY